MNTLYYGDNLDILRDYVSSESVDLTYLDPPFNSNRSYNVLFKTRSGKESAAQIEAFDDTWTWSDDESGVLLEELVRGGIAPRTVGDTLVALQRLLGKTDLMAYLVMMAARLVELHRVLKPTGSLYLHCDPTASHYLKVILDSVFGPRMFRNEVIWKRTTAHSSAKKFAPIHDVILYYGKSGSVTWNEPRAAYSEEYLEKYYRFDDGDGRLYWRADLTGAGTRKGPSGQPWRGFNPADIGRHWIASPQTLDRYDEEGRIYYPKGGGMPQFKKYRDELKGRAVADIWDEVARINPVGRERLGYPTQKPLALLDRIIAASSNPGDVVLDAFCGCGTAIDSSQRLGRQWIGIDITILAIDLIKRRLQDAYGDQILADFRIFGTPIEFEAAEQLWNTNRFEFERWAVTLVDGEPNEKQVGDKGVDGVIRFAVDQSMSVGEALVSVKGGENLNPSMVRDLTGTVTNRDAQMGIMLTLNKPTDGMLAAAASSGVYVWPFTEEVYPRAQIVTIRDLLEGNRQPNMPPAKFRPYLAAQRHRANTHQQMTFG